MNGDGDISVELVLLQELARSLAEAHTLAAIERRASAALADAPDDAAFGDAAAAIVELARCGARTLRRVSDVSRRAHEHASELRTQLRATSAPTLIGSSAALRAIVERADLVARHASTVLIRGESGTGKELLARRIHALSPRRSQPFIRVNCGALPESLLESELFGHERGAFTGADRRHFGRFEQADGGTLLLDEVAELSPPAQVKLLRVLQEGELERLGGRGTMQVDVRVIAATHQPLEALVRSGAFREDLYYRLNVFAVEVPPLRERTEDLAPIARHLVDRIARRLGLEPPPVTDHVVTRLARHDWPGNVRELENVLETALILSPPGELVLAAAPLRRRVSGSAPTGEVLTFEESSRRCIEAALAASAGRIYGSGGAAERLDLKPSTLQSKMRKLGISREDASAR